MNIIRYSLFIVLFLSICGFYIDEVDAGEVWRYATMESYDGTYPDVILSTAISADGRYIVAGTASDWRSEETSKGRVYSFSNDISTPRWTHIAYKSVYEVDITPDGQYIAAGSKNGMVYLFDIQNKKIPFDDGGIYLWARQTQTGRESWVTSVAISDDGEYVAAGSRCTTPQFPEPCIGSLWLFNKRGTPLWAYDFEANSAKIAISSDGQYIAAASGNSTYLFHRDSTTPLWIYDDNEWLMYSIDISADGQYIAVGSGYTSMEENESFKHSKISLFHINSNNTPLWSYKTNSSNQSSYTEVVISANGDYIVAGVQHGIIYLFNKESSTPLWTYDIGINTAESSNKKIESVSISANGEYIAAGGCCIDTSTDTYPEDLVLLFNKESNTPLSQYVVQSVFSVSISADGRYIVAAGGTDGNVYLFSNDGGSIPAPSLIVALGILLAVARRRS